MRLKIADDLTLPIEAATQTFGILAVRGAGKSNLAAVMAEEMFRCKLPFIVIDPTGTWYGLRSSADGKASGLLVPIFGGRKGDVPLERVAGQLIADLVVDQRLSCVVDTSEFSEGDKIRFLIDFGERLYRRNEDPLHLFLEEADDYIPQRPFREQARCLRVFENIVRRGRARGLGITMISQRSAALNKMVLTQIETLIVLRTTSPQDRKAIEAWVEYHGQRKELIESLPGLKSGEAWVWSPSWLGILKQITAYRRKTFDSAATPKDVKAKRAPATLADIDLSEIQKRMAATIERAKQEDPRELRRQIADLKAQVAQAQTKTAAVPMVKAQEVPVIQAKQIQQLTALAKRLDAHRQTFDRLVEYREALGEVSRGLWTSLEKIASARGAEAPKQSEGSVEVIPAASKTQRFEGSERDDLGKCEGKVLQVLAQHPAGCQIGKLALLSGYRVSGGFRNTLSSLRTQGLMTGPNTGAMVITPEGQHAIAGRYDPLPQGQALIDYWLQHPSFGKCEREVLRVLVDVYPQGLSIAALAEKSGYEVSGGFRNALSRLRTAGVLEGRNTEAMRASRELLGW